MAPKTTKNIISETQQNRLQVRTVSETWGAAFISKTSMNLKQSTCLTLIMLPILAQKVRLFFFHLQN